MFTPLLLFLLTVSVVSSWDCEYRYGSFYKYQYKSELNNRLVGNANSNNLFGITLLGEVTLVPLELEKGSFLVEVFFERITQHNVDAMYGHILDHSTFTAIFNEDSDVLMVPLQQHVYGSNIVRGIVSALKVKSCQRTGVYSVPNEVSVNGEHISVYESNTFSQLLLDGHSLFPVQESLEGLYEDRERVVSTVRTVGHKPNLKFSGSTAANHQEFLGEIIHNGTSIEYNYMMGSDSTVQSCVLYEEYSPNHITGYGTSSHISIRTSLSLLTNGIDPLSTHKMSLAEIRQHKLKGAEFENVPMEMETVMPDLRPESGFNQAAIDLAELVGEGYDTTSIPVLETWLDLVRNIYEGITPEEGRHGFDRNIDLAVLPWLIDAANLNGSAQLHLLAHSSIKMNRAQKLTERFIRTKQFTADPPHRMLRWLLKTCGIERYKGACALALASSATNSHLVDPSNTYAVLTVFQFLRNTIEKSSALEDRLFFVRSLDNFKLEESVQYLLQIAMLDGNVEMRRVAMETLFTQDRKHVSFAEREVLLEKGLSEEGSNGAPFIHYVIATADIANIRIFTKRASDEICRSGHHPLASFLREILIDLVNCPSDKQRSAVYQEELSKLYVSCQMCSVNAEVQPADWTSRNLAFGSWLLGGELHHARYATNNGESGYEEGRRRTSPGTSTLSLPFLRRFGLKTDILQTMIDLPELSTFPNDRSNPALFHAVVDGQRVQPVPFMVGEKKTTGSNVLLTDASVIIPTLTGIPLSYTQSGTMRIESSVTAEEFPLITQQNQIGILIQSYVKLDGAFLGLKSVIDFNIRYKEEADFSGDFAHFTSTIERMHLKSDTRETMRDSADMVDMVVIATPTTVLDVKFEKKPQHSPYLVYCEENILPRLSLLDSLPLNPDSHLGSWYLSQPSLIACPSNDDVWELPHVDCDSPTILQSLHVEQGKSARAQTAVHVQSRYGQVDWSRHSRVTSVGNERSVRFEGELGDVVKVLRGLWYSSLPGYMGNDMVTVTVEGGSSRQTISVLLHVQCY